MSWLFDTKFGQVLLLIFSLYLIHRLLKKYLSIVIKRAVSKYGSETLHADKKREETIIGLLNAVSMLVLAFIGLLGLLTILGINIAGLITGAGVVGIIIGLGGQNIVKDFMAGIFVLVENQYRVGDIITVKGVSGIVETISPRITRLRDLDGNMHIIPNGSVDLITNRTFEFSNVNMDIGVSYDADIDKVKNVISQTGESLANDKDWKDTILEPIRFLRVDSFGDSAVNVKALGKVVAGSQWDVAGEFRERLKKAFDKSGIEIPYPQRVIHKN